MKKLLLLLMMVLAAGTAFGQDAVTMQNIGWAFACPIFFVIFLLKSLLISTSFRIFAA